VLDAKRRIRQCEASCITIRNMDDMRVGAALRAIRLRRRWRQDDVATRARVSRSLVSLVERGHLGATTLETLRRISAALDVRLDVIPRWRGGELDRLLNARHSELHESVASFFRGLDGWLLAPEVSFSIYGERGVIDILAWHQPTGSLLVIELKTTIIDVNDLVGGVDRKRRLARDLAATRGWKVTTVSSWVIVERGRTNQRRLRAHRSVLSAAFPADGRAVGPWLQDPRSPIAALSMWPSSSPRSAAKARAT
jgi:transcriptional regulator with XRE-family HTH domain